MTLDLDVPSGEEQHGPKGCHRRCQRNGLRPFLRHLLPQRRGRARWLGTHAESRMPNAAGLRTHAESRMPHAASPHSLRFAPSSGTSWRGHLLSQRRGRGWLAAAKRRRVSSRGLSRSDYPRETRATWCTAARCVGASGRVPGGFALLNPRLLTIIASRCGPPPGASAFCLPPVPSAQCPLPSVSPQCPVPSP